MEYNRILEELAACGLSGKKCMGHENGDIKRRALMLKNCWEISTAMPLLTRI